VGREKLHKPKKQRALKLEGLLSKFNPDDLWALLVAAGASPAVRERWVSIGRLVHASSQSTRTGAQPVRAESLESLLEAVERADPSLAILEDYVAADPRLDVRVRLGGGTVRLFPGSVERPIADVDRAHLLAESLDDTVRARMGFGFIDLLDVVLGYTDFAIAQLSPAWPAGEPEAPFALADAEVDSAQVLISAGTPNDLRDSDAKRGALEWLTCEAADLEFEAGHPQSPFGRFLRFRDAAGAEPKWLPLAFVPEVLSFALGELAKIVSEDPTSRFKFAQRSAEVSRSLLWRFTDRLTGMPDLNDGPAVSPDNVVQWIVPLGERRSHLIQVLSVIDAAEVRLDVTPAALAAAKVAATGEEIPVPLAAGKVLLPAGSSVVPLLIVSAADHILTPQEPGLASMSLDDLRWASRSADSSTDLISFSRDMARPGRPPLFGFEAIDYWEWWRANGKSLFAGGKSPTLMSIAPHSGEAEWIRAAGETDVEVALATLGLPALRDTVGLAEGATSPALVFQLPTKDPETEKAFSARKIDRTGRHIRPQPIGWSVLTGPVPVATLAASPTWVDLEHGRLLHDMAGAISFAIKEIGTAWAEAHDELDVVGHVVDLATEGSGIADGPVLWISDHSVDQNHVARGIIKVDFARFMDLANGKPEVIRGMLSSVLGDWMVKSGAADSNAERLRGALLAAPPTMTLDVLDTPTLRNNLPSPIGLDPAFKSDADRIVAEQVFSEGVAPGVYEGDVAKSLDRDVLSRIALDLLETRLSGYQMDDLVVFGMQQIQRAVEQRNRELRSVRSSARSLSLEWDPLVRAAQIQAEGLLLRRCNEIAIEAALRAAPQGADTVDEQAWAEILAAANAYFEATMRSESVHYQVTPTSIRISESFEITTPPAPITAPGEGGRAAYPLDSKAYSDALIAEGLQEDESPATPPGAEVVAMVDAEVLAAFGASALDIYTTLFCLASWPSDPDGAEVVVTSIAELRAWISENSQLVEEPNGTARIEAATDLLMSTASGLQEEDWRPWLARTRRRRLLVQPLPVLSTGEVVIAPHYLLATAGVYRNYLDQGQLPWSQPPPAALEKALEKFRDAKNRALESDVVELLRSNGWTVENNIKETKPQRLGLKKLSTEIDAVAGRAGRRVIWLLEAKDPVSVHATPQVRGQLDDFYLDRTKKPSYASQLRRKLDDLAPHASEVAAALGLPPRDEKDPYVIKAAFVTRNPVPAAFVAGPFDFLTLGGILKGLGFENTK
jgi:hypothetical protein